MPINSLPEVEKDPPAGDLNSDPTNPGLPALLSMVSFNTVC